MKVNNNSSFFSRIVNGSAKAIGAVTKSKPVEWIGDKFQKDPEKALALTTVGSIIVKDGVGCYKYVTQSLNNKDIPDDRRNFVAALDLSNGVLMILAQIGMFFAMRKFSEPIFNKMFKKSFNPQTLGNLATKLRMDNNSIRKLVYNKEAAKVRKDALDLFKFVADIAAATIIGKRVIVPFVATPVANVIKNKMDEDSKAKNEQNVEDKNDDDDLKINKENKVEEVKESQKKSEIEDEDDDD